MLVCIVPRCGRPRQYADGMCTGHRMRVRRHGDLQADVPLRTQRIGKQPCRLAGCERISHARGLCNTHYQRVNRYGFGSYEAILALVEKQDGCCAVCQIKFDDDWFVDHDHRCCPGVRSCGRCVRGLLCTKCNVALGMVGDNPETIRNLIEYLQRIDLLV